MLSVSVSIIFIPDRFIPICQQSFKKNAQKMSMFVKDIETFSYSADAENILLALKRAIQISSTGVYGCERDFGFRKGGEFQPIREQYPSGRPIIYFPKLAALSSTE